MGGINDLGYGNWETETNLWGYIASLAVKRQEGNNKSAELLQENWILCREVNRTTQKLRDVYACC